MKSGNVENELIDVNHYSAVGNAQSTLLRIVQSRDQESIPANCPVTRLRI
jgi:hypothetical protein